MQRSISRRCLLAGVLLAAAAVTADANRAAGAGRKQAGAPLETPPIYVKKATWPETMLATRTAYLRQLAEQSASATSPQPKPFMSGSIRGDGPAQRISVDIAGWRWLRLVTVLEEGSGNLSVWGEATLIAKDGAETRLSSLKPFSVSTGWGQLCVDKNWQDQPLRIGEKQFAHGLWVHTDSDVCYALEGKYARFEAWIGMDQARPTGAARFKVLPDSPDQLAAAWQRLAADFPRQSRWFVQDNGKRGHLDWFRDAAGAKHEQACIGQALRQAGPAGKGLSNELAELVRAKAPADDPRWLDLYSRACRYRDCATALERTGPEELRGPLEAQLKELVEGKTPADDPRWAVAERKAAALGTAVAPLLGFSGGNLRRAAATLKEALPGTFAADAALLERLDEHERRWAAAVSGLARGEDESLRQAPALCAELENLRRELLRSVRGMSDFLASTEHIDLAAEWDRQYAVLQHDLRTRDHFARVAPEALRRDALILDDDRDPADVALRRTAALLADLRPKFDAALAEAGAHQCGRWQEQLDALRSAAAQIEPKETAARYVLFAAACKLRREIALRNPLLNFDALVFIKRHRPTYNHMCDQYYGITARPGGGLFVLEGPFGPQPRLRNLLADAAVGSGRLQGQKLEGGSFLSPAISYDGQTVYFAYVECSGDARQELHTDPTRGHWSPGRCYHVFQVRADGTQLVQLTDGTWNEFAPCPLPNGRVAFISERRGGYLRCGRQCPTYTLYDMAAGGGDFNSLSIHETNEWHPSVAHDGRIIYTRWDYIDRHGCTAHMPWLTTLDGRDSRALHGNFAPRPARPDMELDLRAVPGSPKYSATAAPHHGQAFGSLVLVDPQVPDDDAMGPVKRITPDVGFPESQGGLEAYATAWPLTEDYYLCVYDAGMVLDKDARNGRGDYGIYLVDSFGNKELVYRDPEIACQSPVPLRATARPLLTAEVTGTAAKYDPASRPAAEQHPGEATLAVINVYDSIKPWPEGTRIQAIRVLQVLPMTVPSGGPPHETGLRVASAGDSVVPVRHVLGTVPVEEDGSVHFIVPANREMFFQALDERGLAVQSMRSVTYLKRGEHLVCQGCHEPKHRVPRAPQTLALALRRAPSRPQPDVDGSLPFSYPRLVQPVLDRLCVECHAKQPEKAPNLAREPIQRKFYASYLSLAPKFGFTNYGHAYRTTPGQFGARASKLLEILDKGHYDVKLSPEDFHRLTLWLDCSSMFYGVYEKEGGEAQLRGEIAWPTLE